MKSWHYEMAERYFGLKVYKVDDIRLFVKADRITEEEFKEITGEDYNKPVAITEETENK